MKWLSWAATLGTALLIIGWLTTAEGAEAIAFGWWAFLSRVSRQMTVDWPSVASGATALVLFTIGVHWFASSLRGGRGADPGASRCRWKLRWTVVLASLVIIMFAAGTAVVGVIHQIGWLANSTDPLFGENVVPAMHSRRQIHNSHLNDMRIIAHGFGNASSATGRAPSAATVSDSAEQLHGWELHILPFLPYAIGNIDKSKAWNDPVNQRYFKFIIPEFINAELRTPPLVDEDGYGLNHFAANSRVITSPTSRPLQDADSNTILFGEVNDNFSPWGRPMNVRDPAAGIDRGPQTFGGPKNAGGATFGMADGSVRFIGEGVDPAVLEALSTPSGDDARD